MTDLSRKSTNLYVSETAAQQLKEKPPESKTPEIFPDTKEKTQHRTRLRAQKREQKQALLARAIQVEKDLIASMDRYDIHLDANARIQAKHDAESRDYNNQRRFLEEHLHSLRLEIKQAEKSLAEMTPPTSPDLETKEEALGKIQALAQSSEDSWKDLQSLGHYSHNAAQKARKKYGTPGTRQRMKDYR